MIQLRNHTYYLRLAIPKRLQSIVLTKQIYSSLRTKDRSVAELKVAQLTPLIQDLRYMATTEKLDRAAVQKLLQQFEKKLKPHDDLAIPELEGEISYLESCQEELALSLACPATNTVSPERYNKADHGSDLANDLFSEIGYRQISARTRFEADKDLFALCSKRQQQTISALYGTSTESPKNTELRVAGKPIDASPRISQVIGDFIKIQTDRLTLSTVESYQSKLDDLVELTGDIRLSELDAHRADNIRDTLRRLPPNRKKIKEFRGLSISELVALKTKPMGEQTVYGFISCYKVFFTWCKRYYPYIGSNPFESMPAPKRGKLKESELRESWPKPDLKRLFASELFSKKQSKYNYQYWLPLLGLYTGARLNELCQLMATDVSENEGVWCISITDTGDRQKLKNANSRRIVPIHSKLIELGFIRYAQSRGKQRLFSDLNHTERAGFGAYPSKWFARFRNGLGLTATFHGLRKTFADELKQAGVEEKQAGELMGHNKSGITYGRYAGSYSVTILQSAIEFLDFDNELKDVKPYVQK